ncbi:MAG: hypothetical protein ACI4OR_04390 [Alphaproteobacteria bacterium]
MVRFLLFCCVSVLCQGAMAQTSALGIECQEAVRAGENIRNPAVYAACGFDERQKAFGEWALWAEKEKAGQALYEICVRHPEAPQAERYCQKAVQLGNGPALVRAANQKYQQKEYAAAAGFYTRALSSPLLSEAEKGDISQKMGLLYLNPDSNYYNPAKGLLLIERAVGRRGAEANNLMGVYALFGMQGVPQNAEKSFEYLWRAVLLGCPAAEENLGLWHLAKQKKISTQTTRQEMSKRMFSCVAPEYVAPAEIQKNNCDCQEVAERERLAGLYPYRLVAVAENLQAATVLDPQGQRINAKVGTELGNKMKVSEIKKKAVFLTSGGARMVLNLAPVDNCPELCRQQKAGRAALAKTIKPYHLTFTPRECSDILYYAERLVDTNLPFTGKTECSFSAEMDKTTDLLMNL